VTYTKDKDFYEEALEARMNQLEEMEVQNDQLKQKLDESRKMENKERARAESLVFDNEMLQKNNHVSFNPLFI
jgi:hypothetical protein